MLFQLAVEVGRSPSWQETQLDGELLPIRCNLPPVQLLLLAWQETQSASATLAV